MKPIIMGAESVRAILDGRKTMTRRVVDADISNCFDLEHDGTLQVMEIEDRNGDFISIFECCPYGKVGGRLWVRESWSTLTYHEGDVPIHIVKDNKNIEHDVVYYAECPDFSWMDGDGFQEYRKDGTVASHWKSPIYMPRWASRITLEITDIRVERVQDITEDDAIAEGVESFNAVASYSYLWDSINAKRGYPWEKNPWVWVISFKQIHNQNEE